MKAVIVGAGIGGLATAIALAQDGHAVEVLEQAKTFTELGAGLQLSPNAMRVLDYLGVSARLKDSFYEPEFIELRMGISGRRIFRLPMKDTAQARWGAPYMQVHRADLQRALLSRLNEVAGDVVQNGCRVTGFVRTPNGAAVNFDGGKALGALVVGADGIHSVIRAQMHGRIKARFTGNVAWRVIVPIDRLPSASLPEGGCIWAGEGRHAVTTKLRQGREVNFVGVVEKAGWETEGWAIEGTQADALQDFEGWHPTITAILQTSDNLFQWALHDRAPLDKWSDGPVVLLGDAAHPMLPSMAQGAAQALEDAITLSRKINALGKVDDAVLEYESVRKPRTSAIQSRSAKNLELFHRAAGLPQISAYGPAWLAGTLWPSLLQSRQDWIYGYDAGA